MTTGGWFPSQSNFANLSQIGQVNIMSIQKIYIVVKCYTDNSGWYPLTWTTDFESAKAMVKLAGNDLKIYEVRQWPFVADWTEVRHYTGESK